MKRFFAILLILSMTLCLMGCDFVSNIIGEGDDDEEDVVNLGEEGGEGEGLVKWVLVQNNNEYSDVESAYFEFGADSFKYYENGELKKEGSPRITYHGLENSISPLNITLNFGTDSTGLSIFDYLECYTEDERDSLCQFTIMREGYHIDPPRTGGVPVRDYHLSEFPYAFGTYVKEGNEPYTYQNGKANYLNCAKLDGAFVDQGGNKLYFVNNAYSCDPQSVSYDIYMRYENNINNTSVEGTIKLSYYDKADGRHSIAMIYVLHGVDEPSKEGGVSVDADFKLEDFVLGDDSISFAFGEYFYGNDECEYDPNNFIGGVYYKVK
ncbi:MAG: hypothetical protein IKA43_01185 [Clostridia bacterium]|nr:hypothetical protein [Clostridia bacterium]